MVVVQDGRVASRISRRRECVSVNTVLATERGRAGNEDVQRLPTTPNKWPQVVGDREQCIKHYLTINSSRQ